MILYDRKIDGMGVVHELYKDKGNGVYVDHQPGDSLQWSGPRNTDIQLWKDKG